MGELDLVDLPFVTSAASAIDIENLKGPQPSKFGGSANPGPGCF